MKIFSFFKKNNPPPQENSEKREDPSPQSSSKTTRTVRSSMEQREIARNTALKIDAIETEMALDVFDAPRTRVIQKVADLSSVIQGKPDSSDDLDFPSYAKTGATTQLSDTAALVQEAAILFANGQNTSVETILLSAIQEDQLDELTDAVWYMLLDFYQATNNRQKFDGLSMDYAHKFQASPVAWVDIDEASKKTEHLPPKAGVLLAGVLDERITTQLERLKKLSEDNATVRLDVSRVTTITPMGCHLLLQALNDLKSTQYELVLIGALEVTEKIQAILQVGRRDETQAPWLLLLELLRILDRKQDFEEVGINFCITFEISPPSFETPSDKIAATTESTGASSETEMISSGFFMLPNVIEGNIDLLLDAINEYGLRHHVLIFGCVNLTRVSFDAAVQLLSRLTLLADQKKEIEFHQMTHLIAALFNVVGLNRIAKIIPRKS